MTTLLGVTHTVPTVVLPPGSCDCHTHVFGPVERFPWSADRAYTPGRAEVANLMALHDHLGIQRVIIVHPSPYGCDNRVSVDAIAQFGFTRARGVAVIGPATSDDDLKALDAAGMRGARVNLATAGVDDPNAAWVLIQDTVRRIARHGWHLQIFAQLAVIADLSDKLATLPVPVVIDHFGQPTVGVEAWPNGFDRLRRLVGQGTAYVKLSAAYRIAGTPQPSATAALARALIAENPERMVWGSDWPHPGGGSRRTGRSSAPDANAVEPFLPIDDGRALNDLVDWAGSPAMLRKILVETPRQLYGFAP